MDEKAQHRLGLFCLASVCLLLATRWRSDTVVVDRSFLGPLAAAVDDRDAPGNEDAAAELLWGNFDELVYLTRVGDADAMHIVQRLLLREGLPGSCTCMSGCLPDAVFAGGEMPNQFLDQLPRLSHAEQAKILSELDWILRDSPDAGYESWAETRAEYLGSHAAVAAFYSRPEFEMRASRAADEANSENHGGTTQQAAAVAQDQ